MSTHLPNRHEAPESPAVSFAETALRLGGAGEDESRRTGQLDTADDQIEMLFAPQYQTVNSPIHRAVWSNEVDTASFQSHPAERLSDAPASVPDSIAQNKTPLKVQETIDRCTAIVRRHQEQETLLDKENKISADVLNELGGEGYWGLLIHPRFGGGGWSFRHFAQMITQMATVDPTVAGLASVHGCIGAVDPVRTFGTPEQQARFLPDLANGNRLSAFALTEPCAGSDLTALKTTAVLDRDEYIVNGEKLFITNVLPGRTIGLVCRIEGRPAVLIVELPETESDHFYLRRYGLHALKHAHNCGIVFCNFRVPAANRLKPLTGDGLTVAYHGLNLGRIALCANAAGTMRSMLAGLLPWTAYRETYGQAIEKRELVRYRIGRLAGAIVGADALVAWCSDLIDRGYRGEMECVVAKIFGSEMQKEAAIELVMKTHGGRSFLHGHWFGENVHEFLAPCIYEGEGEMLSMALFKSLVKQHGREYFESIGRTFATAGISKPNLLNPRHAWAVRNSLFRYARWMTGRTLRGSPWDALPNMPGDLQSHAIRGQRILAKSGDQISAMMRRLQLQLANRQCRINAASTRVQDAVVMLVTSLYAASSDDPITRQAADTLCRRLGNRLEHRGESDSDYAATTKLGQMISENGWSELLNVSSPPLLMPYK